MEYRVIEAAETEPLTLDEVKRHLRLVVGDAEDDEEDEWLEERIMAAREYCEKQTGIALATQTLEAYLDNYPRQFEIPLPMPPLQSVVSIKHTDSAGVETTLTAGTEYLVDTESKTGRVVLPYGKVWPRITPYPVNPVKIRYIAGHAPETIPRSIKQAMLLLIGYWYENREAGDEKPIGPIAFSVNALLLQYRARWIF